MNNIKNIAIVFNSFFILLFLTFLVDSFTVIEIKVQIIKSIVYLGLMFLCPSVLLFNLWYFKNYIVKISSLIIPIIVLIGIIYFGSTKITFSSSVWTTQNILFINKQNHNNRVEFQLKDIGALGYKKRTVEVIHISNWFMIVKSKNQNFEQKENWIKANE